MDGDCSFHGCHMKPTTIWPFLFVLQVLPLLHISAYRVRFGYKCGQVSFFHICYCCKGNCEADVVMEIRSPHSKLGPWRPPTYKDSNREKSCSQEVNPADVLLPQYLSYRWNKNSFPITHVSPRQYFWLAGTELPCTFRGPKEKQYVINSKAFGIQVSIHSDTIFRSIPGDKDIFTL